jgi:acylphosphatase
MSKQTLAKPAGRRCVVSGRVQGVYYRASTQQRARAAGIVGSARNLPDGSVEVVACGEQDAVDSFIAWLWQGPSAAKVADVTVELIDAAPETWPSGFTTS